MGEKVHRVNIDHHYSKGLELLKLENYQDALDAFDMAIVLGGNEIIYQYGGRWR